MRKNRSASARLYSAVAFSLIAILATVGRANAEQTSITVTGTVNDGCTVTSEFFKTTADLENLVNAAGRLTARSVTLSLGQVACNAGAAKISIQSEGKGLKRQGTSPSPLPQGYTDFVPYTAAATWNTLSIGFSANGGATAQDSAESSAAISGSLNLTISTVADEAVQPLEGTYRDTLIVRVGFLI